MKNVYAVTAVAGDPGTNSVDVILYDKRPAEKLLAECMRNKKHFKSIVTCFSSFEMYLRMRMTGKHSPGCYRITVCGEDGSREEITEYSFAEVARKLSEALQSLSNWFIDVSSKSILGNQDGVWITIYCREVKHRE